MGRVLNSKLLLYICNLLFLICGSALIIFGYYLFTDSKRILLSRLLASTSDQLNSLPQPLFYYISIGISVGGLIAILASAIGFWASCLHTYCFLSIYFLTVVVLLLVESVVCLAITLWPHCLGISLDESKMVKALQAYYGIPGKEQFTIAMDLAQTRFGCCGMNSEINYDMSLWKLQGYGQRDWAVPLSCCILQNAGDKMSHLDPKPANETQCQTLQKSEYEHYRYIESCLIHLNNWYHDQYAIFLGACLVIAIVEFGVLLCIVINCTNISNPAVQMDVLLQDRPQPVSRQKIAQRMYQPHSEINAPKKSDKRQIANVLSEGFKETYIQPQDLYKQRHNTTFRPTAKEYNSFSKNFLE